MTIVVEDGTGKPDAQSYASVAEADSYLSARGYTTWAPLQVAEKEASLLRAMEYFETAFTWKGEANSITQALAWPRKYVTVDNADVLTTVVPSAVKNACIELAFRAAAGPLVPDPAYDDTGRLATKIVRRVGPIDKETTYASRGQMATPTIYRRYAAVDMMVSPYLQYASAGVYR